RTHRRRMKCSFSQRPSTRRRCESFGPICRQGLQRSSIEHFRSRRPKDGRARLPCGTRSRRFLPLASRSIVCTRLSFGRATAFVRYRGELNRVFAVATTALASSRADAIPTVVRLVAVVPIAVAPVPRISGEAGQARLWPWAYLVALHDRERRAGV